MTDAEVEVHLFAEGRVQGVGYREFARRTGGVHGVAGWAHNREDGAVELRLRGAPAAVDAMLADLRRGPPHARVSGLRIVARDGAGTVREPGFRILPTA